MNPKNSPFSILRLKPDASEEEIVKSYRRLAMDLHPDRNFEKGAEADFKRVRQAYELLKTPSSRELIRALLRVNKNFGSQWDDSSAGNSGQSIFNVSKRGQMQRSGSVPGENPMPGQFVYRPASKTDSSVDGGGQSRQRGNWIGRMLSVLAPHVRGDALLFKLAMFCLLLFLANWINLGGMVGTSGPLLVLDALLAAVWQALLAAVATEVLVSCAASVSRHRLITATNKFVVAVVLFSLCVIVVTSVPATFFGGLRGTSQLPPLVTEFVRIVAIGLICFAAYIWLVFCLLFQRHNPIWESLVIWIGVGGAFSSMVFAI